MKIANIIVVFLTSSLFPNTDPENKFFGVFEKFGVLLWKIAWLGWMNNER